MAKKIHRIKLLREFFNDVVSGKKPFEVRRDDRGYAVGDTLHISEYDPSGTSYNGGSYTGREIEKTITYKMPGGRFGLDPNYCVLGLSDLR